jgi:hypothetical protein
MASRWNVRLDSQAENELDERSPTDLDVWEDALAVIQKSSKIPNQLVQLSYSATLVSGGLGSQVTTESFTAFQKRRTESS